MKKLSTLIIFIFCISIHFSYSQEQTKTDSELAKELFASGQMTIKRVPDSSDSFFAGLGSALFPFVGPAINRQVPKGLILQGISITTIVLSINELESANTNLLPHLATWLGVRLYSIINSSIVANRNLVAFKNAKNLQSSMSIMPSLNIVNLGTNKIAPTIGFKMTF